MYNIYNIYNLYKHNPSFKNNGFVNIFTRPHINSYIFYQFGKFEVIYLINIDREN